MKKIEFTREEDVLKRLDTLSPSELSRVKGGRSGPKKIVSDPPIMYVGYKQSFTIG